MKDWHDLEILSTCTGRKKFHLIQSDELFGLGESCPDHVNLSYIVCLLMWSHKYGIYCYHNKITSIIPNYDSISLNEANNNRISNIHSTILCNIPLGSWDVIDKELFTKTCCIIFIKEWNKSSPKKSQTEL